MRRRPPRRRCLPIRRRGGGATLQYARMCAAITETALPLPLARRGKVRDVYDLDDRFLLVATDRISAFDVVLSPGIPDKGKLLNQISIFWFQHFDKIENNILVSDFVRFLTNVLTHFMQ